MSLNPPDPKLEATPDVLSLPNDVTLTFGITARGRETRATVRYTLAEESTIWFRDGSQLVKEVARTVTVPLAGTTVTKTVRLARASGTEDPRIFRITATIEPDDGSSPVRTSDQLTII